MNDAHDNAADDREMTRRLEALNRRPVIWQWNPDDLAQAGFLVGWLMRSGVEFDHPGGMGDATLLRIWTRAGDEEIIRPGDYLTEDLLVYRPAQP